MQCVWGSRNRDGESWGDERRASETALPGAEMALRPARLLVAASSARAAARLGAALPSRAVSVVRTDCVSLVSSSGERLRWFHFLGRWLALLCTAAARLSGDAVSTRPEPEARGGVGRLGLTPTAGHGGRGTLAVDAEKYRHANGVTFRGLRGIQRLPAATAGFCQPRGQPQIRVEGCLQELGNAHTLAALFLVATRGRAGHLLSRRFLAMKWFLSFSE